jgi:molecular chaperone DnaK (HSP70)
MNNYLILIFGYFFLFLATLLTFYRVKKAEITREDLIFWKKVEIKVSHWKNKFLRMVKISEEEFNYLWKNLIEKILRRIKIFGLKIESWASQKLEKMKTAK